MTNDFPCPNPTCTHVFPRAIITGAASLHCPRCGMVFQFRANAPAAKMAAAPAASRTAKTAGPPKVIVPSAPMPATRGVTPRAPSIPSAMPGTAPVPAPVAVPVATPVAGDPFASATAPPLLAVAMPITPAAPVAQPVSAGNDLFMLSPGTASSAPQQSSRWRARIKRAVVLVLLLSGIVGLYVAVRPWLQEQEDAKRSGPSADAGQKHVSLDFSYQFILPGSPWVAEESLKLPLKANLLTMRRRDPDVYLALAAQDYQRTPHDAEVVEEAVRRLGGYFTNFEWDQKGGVPFGGKPAQCLVFQGEVNKVAMSGQCYIVAYKDIAYWFAMWAPAAAVTQAAADLTHIPQGFTVLERAGWKEKRPPEAVFVGTRAGYVLRDGKGLWEKWLLPQVVDPSADLYLQGKDPAEPKNVAQMANVMVLVLPKQNDLPAAMKSARDHLEVQQKKDRPGVILEPLGKEQPRMLGVTPGQMMPLQIKGEGSNRFVLLAVINLPESVLAVQCDCDLKRRSLWERDFNQLLSTFRLTVK